MTILSLVDEAPPVVPYGEPGYDAFTDLWSRFIRPFDVVHTVSCITGLSVSVVTQLVGVAVAGSPEANRLLDELPHTIRSLATSMSTQHERCKGELRGPVLWSETMSARSASYGDPDLFVCASPSRAYDIDENHVLVYALNEVREAARLASGRSGESGAEHHDLRDVRHNAAEATRCLEHPSLRGVTITRPRARAIKRTRTSKHRQSYAPALAMLERAATPLTVDDVAALRDERTRAQHRLLGVILQRLEQHGRSVPDLRVDGGALLAGALVYRPAHHLGARTPDAGILVGDTLVDVPDRLHDPNRRRANDLLQARAGGRQTVLVMDERDVDRAVELALDRS